VKLDGVAREVDEAVHISGSMAKKQPQGGELTTGSASLDTEGKRWFKADSREGEISNFCHDYLERKENSRNLGTGFLYGMQMNGGGGGQGAKAKR